MTAGVLTSRLGDVAQFHNRVRIPLSKRERSERLGDVPYYGANGIIDYVDRSIFSGLHLLVGEDGSVVREDGTAYITLADGQFWVSNHAHVITGKSDTETKFLAYALQSVSVAPYVTGAVQPKLSMGNCKAIEIPFPEEKARREIVETLSALDDKIELNRRMNETLEAQARALFRDWFVDFGPVKAKMAGSPPYLSPDLWSLFPNRLDDDGVPEGWASGNLDQIIEFNPREKLTKGEDAPYLAMADLPTRGSRTHNPVRRAFASGSKFRNGDALLARITPCLENGKTALVDCLAAGIVGWGSTEFIVMRSKPPVPRQVAYLIARDPEFRAAAIQSMSGTSGRQRASVDALTAYPAVIPHNEQVWAALGSFLDPIFDKIAANAEESHSLSQTSDLLLPKLMSGEIRVRDSA